MAIRRGWIFLRSGRTEEVPAFLLDEEEIAWPPTLPEKEPGKGVQYISDKDFYRRHEVVEGEAFVFLAHDRTISDKDREIVQKLLRRS